MPKDYGYFGKGSTGYAHYMTAFKRNKNSPNKGGGNGGNNGGCLIAIIVACAVLAVISIVVK